jgi:hypothetical protein
MLRALFEQDLSKFSRSASILAGGFLVCVQRILNDSAHLNFAAQFDCS